jgi:CRP/FNR family cyclic AMP-dependent transcriptional regulator
MKEFLQFCEGQMPVREFDAGTEILREGETAGVLYVLLEGSAEVVKAGTQINLVTEPGSFFGEMSILLETPHSATVRTLVPSKFYVAENPREFLNSRPEIALAISTLLAQRLQALTTYIVDIKQQFADQEDHLGMLDEVLDSLSHAQSSSHKPGSKRDPDRNVY